MIGVVIPAPCISALSSVSVTQVSPRQSLSARNSLARKIPASFILQLPDALVMAPTDLRALPLIFISLLAIISPDNESDHIPSPASTTMESPEMLWEMRGADKFTKTITLPFLSELYIPSELLPGQLSRAIPTVCSPNLAFLPTPGSLETLIESPFAMTPFSRFTLTGTRPARATAGRVEVERETPIPILTNDSSMNMAGEVEIMPINGSPRTPFLTISTLGESESTVTIYPGANGSLEE